MNRSMVSERYASGLYKAAAEQNVLSEVHADTQELQKALQDDASFMELITMPKLSSQKKHELISTVLPGAHQLLLNTLYVMLDADRLGELNSVLEEFHEHANDAAGIAEAVVYATRDLTEQEKTAISSAFAHKVGKQTLQLTTVIEPALIGGIRLQIGNRIFDSSLSKKLSNLQRSMIK